MDQLSAHLDRGWDLAHKGDAAGANACAKRALELDPKSPEVHNLLGFSSALEGDAEDALEHYRQALTLDETYFDAMLNAAELLIHPLEDYAAALTQLGDALDYAESDDEIAECLLLKSEAHLGKGELEEARKTMQAVPESALQNEQYAFSLGRTFFELGEMDRAGSLLEVAATKHPHNPDAHYYLGLVRDERGDTRGASESFLRTRMLDLERPPPPWAPSPEVFGKMVTTVVQRLDTLLIAFVREAEVYVVDIPGAELVVDAVDPRTLVLLDRPHDEEGKPGQRVRVFIYQRNVELAAGSVDAMEEELTRALEREVAHVFMDRPANEPVDRSALN